MATDQHKSTLPNALRRVYRLHPNDNVAVALADLVVGEAVAGIDGVVVRVPVPFGHKVSIAPIKPGETVFKYGEVIGVATKEIASGDHVHTHNVESQRGRGDLHKQ